MIKNNYTPLRLILLFFGITFFEIIILSLILIISFSLNIYDVIQDKNIPYLAKLIYFFSLYFLIFINIFLLDKKDFIYGIKLSKIKSKFFIVGFIISFSSLFFLYLFELKLKFISLNSYNLNLYSLIFSFVSAFLIAFVEEILFRNFILKKLLEIYSFKKSIIISSYIYSQLHFLKTNISLIEIIIPLMGLFFIGVILAYSFSKYNLWLSIGLHSGWVFVITYTNLEAIFTINENFILFSGGLYPISGILGNLTAIILFISIYFYDIYHKNNKITKI